MKKIRSVFTVKRKEFLTPNFIRVVFEMTNEQCKILANIREGSNNKIFIPPKGVELIYFPNKGVSLNSELVAMVRTYTNRKIDLVKKELTIDFATHGNVSPASAWAMYSKIGDPLGIAMKDTKRPLINKANHYLLVGDATAIPVIACILESLSADVCAKVILEVPTKDDEMIMCSMANVEIEWLHNYNPKKGSCLASKALAYQFENKNACNFVYCAAEYSTVKEVREYYRKTLNWATEMIYTCSYWKAGIAEGANGQVNHSLGR
ncbi:siderophore-interacting protein [Empedobacter tilapiae]|uniref:Siderophore-interacting protein n=1 Tax=Empedobacter tilapiae TaxID=2491114 RepID=A0A4Z1B9P1_9FLAO|nr:siderophore-interacting protein [Empedobacter tilapiae]TGN24247.1 siderophore-interacting protein [Empedobacter tilapiae]